MIAIAQASPDPEIPLHPIDSTLCLAMQHIPQLGNATTLAVRLFWQKSSALWVQLVLNITSDPENKQNNLACPARHVSRVTIA